MPLEGACAMAASAELKRYRRNLQDEIDSAAVYRSMAESEGNIHLAKVYSRLAEVEQRHASIWERQIAKSGAKLRPQKQSFRSRVLVALSKVFGASFVLPAVAEME